MNTLKSLIPLLLLFSCQPKVYHDFPQALGQGECNLCFSHQEGRLLATFFCDDSPLMPSITILDKDNEPIYLELIGGFTNPLLRGDTLTIKYAPNSQSDVEKYFQEHQPKRVHVKTEPFLINSKGGQTRTKRNLKNLEYLPPNSIRFRDDKLETYIVSLDSVFIEKQNLLQFSYRTRPDLGLITSYTDYYFHESEIEALIHEIMDDYRLN